MKAQARAREEDEREDDQAEARPTDWKSSRDQGDRDGGVIGNALLQAQGAWREADHVLEDERADDGGDRRERDEPRRNPRPAQAIDDGRHGPAALQNRYLKATNPKMMAAARPASAALRWRSSTRLMGTPKRPSTAARKKNRAPRVMIESTVNQKRS